LRLRSADLRHLQVAAARCAGILHQPGEPDLPARLRPARWRAGLVLAPRLISAEMRSISFTIFLLLLAIVAGGMVAMRVSEGNLHRVFGPPPTGAGDRLYDFDPAQASSIVLTGNGATAHCVL